MQAAPQESLAQAVTDSALTQEQADTILTQMAGRYEWMLDHATAGYGKMSGHSGMMGKLGGMMGRRFGQQGSDGQVTPGQCPHNMYNSATESQPKP